MSEKLSHGFEFSPDHAYIMPAHFGPTVDGWDGKVARYGNNTTLTISYVSDATAIASLLPEGFVVADPPIISVSFVMCRDVDFLAGGGYNLVSVNAAARFEGKRDRAAGMFALVLWENEFLPIMLGREILGAPKLFAEVPDAWERDGKIGFDVYENETHVLGAEIGDRRPLSPEEIQAIGQQAEGKIWMGWKHIPSCDFRGADLSFATALPFQMEIREAWAGTGSITFHDVPWVSAPVSHRAARALRRLPVRDTLGAIITRGSKKLLIDRQYAMH